MSISWQLDVEPAPRILVLPPDAASLDEAHAAIELWEHYSDKTLDPTQRLAVEIMMAENASGRWAAQTTGREMPRQNGKGDEIEVVELWGLVQLGEAILHTVHDAVLLASQTQQRMLGVLEGHPDLRRKVKRKWQGTGQQMIEMVNGGCIWYRTRTNGGGRGADDINRLVVDEAQHATEEQLAALSPTLLANPNPQLNAMGSAGIENVSRWWWGFRKRALSADPGAFGYVGHTVETVYLDDRGKVVQEPVDTTDRSLWPDANPSVVAGRGGGMAFLEEQFRRLPDSFGREHLGVWDPPPADDEAPDKWQVWTEAEWSACRSDVPGDRQGWLGGDVVLAVEVTPDYSSASISAAGACSDGVGIELVAKSSGTGWIAGKLAELVASRSVVAVIRDPKGPAAALDARMEDAGVVVTDCPAPALAKATGDFHSAVLDREVFHRDRPQLNEAVSIAVKRSYGDLWLIDRRAGDVTPISSAVMAWWGHKQASQVIDMASQIF